MALLSLHGVSKSYGAVKVTNDISLAVEAGETLGRTRASATAPASGFDFILRQPPNAAGPLPAVSGANQDSRTASIALTCRCDEALAGKRVNVPSVVRRPV